MIQLNFSLKVLETELTGSFFPFWSSIKEGDVLDIELNIKGITLRDRPATVIVIITNIHDHVNPPDKLDMKTFQWYLGRLKYKKL